MFECILTSWCPVLYQNIFTIDSKNSFGCVIHGNHIVTNGNKKLENSFARSKVAYTIIELPKYNTLFLCTTLHIENIIYGNI